MKMIEKYLIKKIVITTMSLCLLLLFIIIPVNHKNNKNINKKILNKTIYLIDKDNYVSLVSCYYDSENIKDEIKKKIDLLKNGTSNFDGVLSKDIVVNNIRVDKNNVYIDFNKEFLNIKKITKVYECIIYSLTEINGINNIYISVNNKMLEGMPLNKNYGINKEYDIDDFSYINRTIIYFAKDDYYVPITKINSDKNDKINIILKELKSSVYSLNNLVGYLPDDIELIDYKIKNKKMEIVFNKFILDDQRIKYIISSSIFANYDVDEIIYYNFDKSISISVKKES